MKMSKFGGTTAIFLLAVGELLLSVLIPYAMSEQSTTVATVNDGIDCYACGLSDVDPEKDEPGSFADIRRISGNETIGKKMYNFTCDIADNMTDKDPWIRQCPHGTKSCFWAQGDYGSQVPIFRGCADTIYQFDAGCHRQLQSVELVVGRSSANVEIYLCFCNEALCNQNPNSGFIHLASLAIIAVALLTIILFYDC